MMELHRDEQVVVGASFETHGEAFVVRLPPAGSLLTQEGTGRGDLKDTDKAVVLGRAHTRQLAANGEVAYDLHVSRCDAGYYMSTVRRRRRGRG